ncbi:MAG TPA: hypothetical protein VGB76_05470 [Pyrinomonadaceae bacterium]
MAFNTGAQTIQTTEVSGYIFNGDGTVAAHRPLRIVKVEKNGALISTSTISINSNAAGRVVFNVVRASNVWIEGDVGRFKVPGGLKLTIPDEATASLETLPTVEAIPATGLTAKSNNVLLGGRFGTIDLSSQFALTENPAGELNVTLAQSYTLASELTAHAAASDPHPVYLTQTEGNGLYAALGSGVTAHGLLTGLSDDDHPQYQLRAEKNTANGYVGLDAGALVPDNRLPASIARDTEIATAISALSTVYAALSHTHVAADITNFNAAVLSAIGFTPLDAAATTYALLTGRAGGQTVNGGTGSGENLTLNSTSHSMKGYILLGSGGFVGINRSVPGAQLHVVAGSASTVATIFDTAASPSVDIAQFKNNGTTVLKVSSTGTLLPKGFIDGDIGSDAAPFYLIRGHVLKAGAQLVVNSRFLLDSGGFLTVSDNGSTANGKVNAAEYRVGGTKVLGTQCAAIANATDAATAITQLNSLLACLRTHGSVAP